MRSVKFVGVSLLLLLLACEHKNKTDKGGGTAGGPAGGGGAAGGGGGNTADAVRPPAPEDLATYAKDLGVEAGGKLMARIETPLGTINCELFGDKAPMTVANFVGLATGKKPWLDPKTKETMTNKPYFDGLIFHRVIPGFMIQGGDPLGAGHGGPGYKFGDEFADGLQMGPGALAMANAGPGTNGSQFFIMEGERPDLVGRHTIFGQCKEVEIVQKITSTPATQTRPNEPVTMKVTIGKG